MSAAKIIGILLFAPIFWAVIAATLWKASGNEKESERACGVVAIFLVLAIYGAILLLV